MTPIVKPMMATPATLLPIGPAWEGISETWTHYPSAEEARAGAKLMYQNDRVLRVMVVTDSLGSFVEWIER